MRRALVLCFVIALCPAACATYREDLNRGQRMYEENQYEQALALWRVLEDDANSLSVTDQARYAYLRGMTDYRLGFRADARHWLAVAKVTDESRPGGIRAQWKGRMEQALLDLNQDVYGGGEGFRSSGPGGVEYGKAAPDDGDGASEGAVDAGVGTKPDSGVEPAMGTKPDSGVEPATGTKPDSGVEPATGSKLDAGIDSTTK